MARTALTDHRTASDLLGEARAAIGPRHRAAVDGLPEPLRRVAGYHAGFRDADGTPRPPQSEAGKAIRPALVLACAGAAGGPEAAAAAVPAAVAVELVHDFTLLHDDVMDGDALRRGRPAAWTVYGTAQALLAGNALLAAALRHDEDAGECSAVLAAVLADAVLDMCAGQAADVAPAPTGGGHRSPLAEHGPPSHDGPLTRPDLAAVLYTAELKTGALFGAACELGARTAGAADPARYRAFGRLLGRAFQLVDDVLGIWGDPSSTGKPAGCDPAAARRSAPVVWALTSGTGASARLAKALADPSCDAGSTADLIAATGARRWALAEARRLTDAALDCLDRASPRPEGAADLRVLASALVDRVC